ncbi:MAG: efflux RND transporter periplasmic adaptor subunit [Bryobacteraceae bacterium]|nr:efflux RND transporter periplasmic adaptor subunit [Bryobacteraceae bacterium]
MSRSCIVIAVAVLAHCLAGCGSKPPQSAEAVVERAAPPEPRNEVVIGAAAQREAGVAIQEVLPRSLPETLQATGRITLNENRSWRVGATTAGAIFRVYANPGDAVKEGDILARMHSHEIHEARAEYRRAVAELDRLKNALAFAQRQRDRMRRLYELKAASLQQVEQAETEFRNAEAAIAHGEVELERTRFHLVDYLKVPLEESQRLDSEETLIPIVAPASGTLLQRNVTPGTVVEPSAPLFVITDLSTLWMIAAVNEEHLAKLRTGMPARVFVQAYPDRPFPGRVVRLGEELDPTTRTIMARVELPNGGGLLKPEMYATAELDLGGSRPAIFLPHTALQELGGDTVVFIRRGEDRFEARPVATGRSIGAEQEILRGVRPGESVAVGGSFILKSQLLRGSLSDE